MIRYIIGKFHKRENLPHFPPTSASAYAFLTLCCHVFNNDDNDNICTWAISYLSLSLSCVVSMRRWRRKSYYYHRQLKFETIEVGSALHDLCQFDKIILLFIINVCRHPSAPLPPTTHLKNCSFCLTFVSLFFEFICSKEKWRVSKEKGRENRDEI